MILRIRVDYSTFTMKGYLILRKRIDYSMLFMKSLFIILCTMFHYSCSQAKRIYDLLKLIFQMSKLNILMNNKNDRNEIGFKFILYYKIYEVLEFLIMRMVRSIRILLGDF